LRYSPSAAGRDRCVALLDSLISAPPSGFVGLSIDEIDGKRQSSIAKVAPDELDGRDAAELFDEHVDEHGQAGARLQYRVMLTDDDGRPRSGARRSWGMPGPARSSSGDAESARRARGGGELASATLSRNQAETTNAVLGQFQSLVQAAAGERADGVELALATMEERVARELWWTQQTMVLRDEMRELRAVAEAAPSFWSSEAGAAVLGQVGGVAAALLPVVVELVATLVQSRQLANLERQHAIAAAVAPTTPSPGA